MLVHFYLDDKLYTSQKKKKKKKVCLTQFFIFYEYNVYIYKVAYH